jgi:hypothetical protein
MNTLRADGTPTSYAISQVMLHDATPIGRPAPTSTPVPESAVATQGFGTFRTGCQDRSGDWNAWLCPSSAVQPERLIIESLDGDTETRNVNPVALASGGYVHLLNGGKDHGWCFGYTCLKRLSTFHATIAANRSYDLAFPGTNPQRLRLMMPMSAPDARVIVALRYQDPSRLSVRDDTTGRHVADLNLDASAAALVEPTLDMPCNSNAFRISERKMLVLVCGGGTGLRITTDPVIVLSIGVSLTVDQFFNPATLARNLVSLLGISADRIRVSSSSPSATQGRRLQDPHVQTSQVEVAPASVCDDVECGAHGGCIEDAADPRGRRCMCDDGHGAEPSCNGFFCQCSRVLGDRRLQSGCGLGTYNAGGSLGCQACHAACAACSAGGQYDCTGCDWTTLLTELGSCVTPPANAALTAGTATANSDGALHDELVSVSSAISSQAEQGTLDVGYSVASIGIYVPPARNTSVINASDTRSTVPTADGVSLLVLSATAHNPSPLLPQKRHLSACDGASSTEHGAHTTLAAPCVVWLVR